MERLSAGVDYPISLFWKDLVKMYPNAKVCLLIITPSLWWNTFFLFLLKHFDHKEYEKSKCIPMPRFCSHIHCLFSVDSNTYNIKFCLNCQNQKQKKSWHKHLCIVNFMYTGLTKRPGPSPVVRVCEEHNLESGGSF